MKENIYIIGIGGIGVSAVARYYNELGYTVYGDDAVYSELTQKLESEGIILSSLNTVLKNTVIQKCIYTEAIASNNHELLLAQKKEIALFTYPQALAEIANKHKLITIAGTHGKSTTTSLSSLVLKNSDENFTAVVGTILKEFANKNFFHRARNEKQDHFFVIEACEYKRSFLNYMPTVGIITNIELDHLDYFTDENDYLEAFKSYLNNIKPGGFAIINGDDAHCQTLKGLRNDIQYIEVFDEYFSFDNQIFQYPCFTLQVPGKHIMFDAKIAYIIGYMLGIADINIIQALEGYTGVWRRMEIITTTPNHNILMSDYGHHPTEINLTLNALKEKYPDKHIYTIFQPHQYNRTLQLISEFKNCFHSADTLIIPNIYESRDTPADKKNMPLENFIMSISHKNIFNGHGLYNTLQLLQSYDAQNPRSSIILLLGAGDVDTLRYTIKGDS